MGFTIDIYSTTGIEVSSVVTLLSLCTKGLLAIQKSSYSPELKEYFYQFLFSDLEFITGELTTVFHSPENASTKS